MITGFLHLPWLVWAVLALIVAILFVFIWPQKAAVGTSGFRLFIIRWGHSLTWILLALNFFLRSLSPSLTGTANLIALAGGVMYVLFIVMAFAVK